MTMTFSLKCIIGIIIYSTIYGLGLGFGFWAIGVALKHGDYYTVGLIEARQAGDLAEEREILISLARRIYVPSIAKQKLRKRIKEIEKQLSA